MTKIKGHGEKTELVKPKEDEDEKAETSQEEIKPTEDKTESATKEEEKKEEGKE